MSTVLWMPNYGSAPITVTPSITDWTLHDRGVRRQLLFTNAGGGGETEEVYSPDGVDHHVAGSALHSQYVSAVMPAQVVPAQVITFSIATQEGGANNNLRMRWKVYAVDASGALIGNIVPVQDDGSEFNNVTIEGRTDFTAASTAVDCTVPWHMVVEFGANGTPSSSGGTDGHNFTMRTGVDGQFTQDQHLVDFGIPLLLFATDIDDGTWTPATPSDVTQYRLMLAEATQPDLPVLNITDQSAGANGTRLVRTERGLQRAVLGEPPAAGSMTLTLQNDGMANYNLEEPSPGLAVRLNKFVGGVAYPMCTVNLDEPVHTLDGFRAVVQLQGYGPLTKLANKKVSTALYKNITTGAAIGYLLDELGFPSFLRDLDTGLVTLRYWWCNDEDAMAALNKLINSEGITAELYEQGDGVLRFRQRDARFTESRSTEAQSAFTSQGSAPRLSDFQYFSGGREVVNEATHDRIARSDDEAPTVVWQDDNGAGSYTLTPYPTPGSSLTFVAVATEPFFDAIVPEEGTDYIVGLGAVSVSLERTSGQRTRITFTAGAGGATIGAASGSGITLRATATIVGATFSEQFRIEEDDPDAPVPFTRRTWSGEMSKELEWWDMRDNLEALVRWKMIPRGRVRVLVKARTGLTDNNLAIAQREIGDRIRVTNQNHDFDGYLWIQRIEHEVIAPASLAEAPGDEVGTENTWYEGMVISVESGSVGVGVGEENPFDTINYEDYVLPGDLTDQTPATYGILAGAGI